MMSAPLPKEVTMDTTLKKLRIDRNVSQQDLADLIGVSIRSLSRYENGSSLPTVDAAIKLATYYGLSVEELFSASP